MKLRLLTSSWPTPSEAPGPQQRQRESRRRSQSDLALERWREVDRGRCVRRDRIAQQYQATALLRQFLECLRQGSSKGLGSRHCLVLVAFARTGLGHQVGELLLLQAIALLG